MGRVGASRSVSCLGLVAVVPVLVGVFWFPLAGAGARSTATRVERPSFVYPPDGVKWFPLRVPGSHSVKGAGGVVAQVVELRGWLTFVGKDCYGENADVPAKELNKREPDWHYNLELDPAWLDHLGIKDPNVIVRPGNVINSATRVAQPGNAVGHETGPLATPSPWGITARPIVHIEVASWDPSRHPGERPPDGWRALTLPGCRPDVRWPYDPRNPVAGQPALTAGQYVRMVGSLVTDDPHVRITAGTPDYAASGRDLHGILGGDDPITLAARLFWEQGRLERDPANAARWSELHPPDTVEVLGLRPRSEVVQSVLIATPPDLGSDQTFALDVNLRLPEPAVPSAMPKVVEVVGTDTRPNSLWGSSSPPPTSRVTITPSGVHLHIDVARRGNATTPSRFEAIYRISY